MAAANAGPPTLPPDVAPETMRFSASSRSQAALIGIPEAWHPTSVDVRVYNDDEMIEATEKLNKCETNLNDAWKSSVAQLKLIRKEIRHEQKLMSRVQRNLRDIDVDGPHYGDERQYWQEALEAHEKTLASLELAKKQLEKTRDNLEVAGEALMDVDAVLKHRGVRSVGISSGGPLSSNSPDFPLVS